MEEARVLVLLFGLRCIVPLIVTFAIGYAMTRLYERWVEAEEEGPARTPAPVRQEPCWSIRGCDPVAVRKCPAFQHPERPCWVNFRLADGAVQSKCRLCPVFGPVQA